MWRPIRQQVEHQTLRHGILDRDLSRFQARTPVQHRRSAKRRRVWRWRHLQVAAAATLLALLTAYALAARALLESGQPLTALDTGAASPEAFAARTNVQSPESDDAAAVARGNPARTGEISAPGPRRALNLLWSIPTGGEIVAEPVVFRDYVYVGSGDGILYAIEAATGSIHWRFPTSAPITGAVTVAADVVFLASGHSAIYAIDASNGRELWRTEIADRAASPAGGGGPSPLVVGELVYIASAGIIAQADGRLVAFAGPTAPLLALDVHTGQEVWTLRPHSDALVAVDLGDRALLWQIPRSDLSGDAPAILNGVVFLTEQAETGVVLLAIDVNSGAVLWQEQTHQPLALGLALAGGRALVGAAAPNSMENGGGLFAILVGQDVTGNRLNWKSTGRLPDPASGLRFIAYPVVASGFVYASSSEGALLAVELASGQVRRRYSAGTPLGPPTVAGSVVYVGGQDGRVFAIGNDEAEMSAASATTAAVAPTIAPLEPGQIAETRTDDTPLRSAADANAVAIATLSARTEVAIVGLAVDAGTAVFLPVEVPATGQHGYLDLRDVNPVSPLQADTGQAAPTPQYLPDQTIYVIVPDVLLRTYPSQSSGNGTPLPFGTTLVVDSESLSEDALGYRWLHVTLAADARTAGFVREDQVASGQPLAESGAGTIAAASAATLSPEATPNGDPITLTSSTALSVTSRPPIDLRYVEFIMAVDVVALAAGDAAAIAGLRESLSNNLNYFQPGRCQPATVVIAVGASGAPDQAIAAAAIFESAIRATHQPAFSTVDVLTFADPSNQIGRVLLRVYHVQC